MNAAHDNRAASGDNAGRSTFLQTLRAVGWSFFGVRKRAEFEKDAKLNPVHIVIAGVLAAAVFVTALVLLVRWVIATGTAA